MSFVLALDFGGTKIAATTAALDGTLLIQEEIPTLGDAGAEQALRRAIESGLTLVARTRRDHGGELLGVGVSSMGVTLEDRVLMAAVVPGWEQLAMPGRLRDAFDVPVRTVNDVKAATLAELRWGALLGVQHGIYLNLGSGLAAGLVVDSHVVEGAHGAAGEIGYGLRHPHEELGAAHGHVPLEEFAGGQAIANRARALFGETCTPDELFRRARTDVEARVAVDITLNEIAFHLANLAIALDPERIVVGGGLIRSADLILPRLQVQMNRFLPFPPDVVPAHFSLQAALIGAIAVILDAL